MEYETGVNIMWRSRKFLTLILDTAVSLAIYFTTKFVAPDLAEHVLFVIGALQPVALAVIVMWGVEDAAAKRSGTFNDYRPRQ
jgi:hypothetical protein